jgi:hypothetical protein
MFSGFKSDDRYREQGNIQDSAKENVSPKLVLFFYKSRLVQWTQIASGSSLANLFDQFFFHQRASKLSTLIPIKLQAPEPLLANYGAGQIRQYNLDTDMMALINSEERQLDPFVTLGDAAGLKSERWWDFGGWGLLSIAFQPSDRIWLMDHRRNDVVLRSQCCDFV